MPQKKTQVYPCFECNQTKKEDQMQGWDARGWRCSGCYNAELSYLRELRHVENVMRGAAKAYYLQKPGTDINSLYKKYTNNWNWEFFFTCVDEHRKDHQLLKEARPPSPNYIPWEEEEAIKHLESLPPLEHVDWADYPED